MRRVNRCITKRCRWLQRCRFCLLNRDRVISSVLVWALITVSQRVLFGVRARFGCELSRSRPGSDAALELYENTSR